MRPRPPRPDRVGRPASPPGPEAGLSPTALLATEAAAVDAVPASPARRRGRRCRAGAARVVRVRARVRSRFTRAGCAAAPMRAPSQRGTPQSIRMKPESTTLSSASTPPQPMRGRRDAPRCASSASASASGSSAAGASPSAAADASTLSGDDAAIKSRSMFHRRSERSGSGRRGSGRIGGSGGGRADGVSDAGFGRVAARQFGFERSAERGSAGGGAVERILRGCDLREGESWELEPDIATAVFPA